MLGRRAGAWASSANAHQQQQQQTSQQRQGGAEAGQAVTVAAAAATAAAAAPDQPDYSDIPNFDRVANPGSLTPTALPFTLRVLCHVSLVISSRRSAVSGSPTHVFAKLWVA